MLVPYALLELPYRRVVQAAVRVIVAHVEVRRHGAGQHGLRHATAPVPADVAGDLPPAHREPDQCDTVQIQVREQRVEVRGEGVVVVAAIRLGGMAEAAAVVGYDAVAGVHEGRDLLLPRAARERPAVDQDDRAPRAVVLVVQLDRSPVLFPYTHKSQNMSSLLGPG